ncbi:MAG TPA: urea ABC transporter ATP-binding subunit UrtE [Planctomycetaceae bacterium]|nr:urea ABC transporter ATP-binding subunit UrtE [Planctomycetaceae bacterium]
MLTVNNVSFSHGSIRTLQKICMSMNAGEITCIMGRNGVGKTTLLKNIMGTLRASHGSIQVGSDDITSLAAHRRAKNGLGLVPQGRQIFAKLTVEENLRVGLQANPRRTSTIPSHVYEIFPVLLEMKRRMGGDLSGGQQQQLAIARALVGNPKILLLDEPTEGIQPNIIQQIGRVLKDLATESNMTIVLVEQYLDFVREFGDKFYLMNRGRVVADGTTEELTDELVSQHLSV